MTKLITNNLVGIILIALLLFVSFQANYYMKERNRWQDNFEQKDSSRYHKLYSFTKNEFKEAHKKDSLLDELMDSLKINYRHIVKTINRTYKYSYDTTIVHLYPSKKGIKKFNHKFDNCLSISGQVDWDFNKIQFDSTVINYNETSLYYWKRSKKFLKIIPYGRKINYVETKNNCSGKTKIEEIKIVRK